MTAGGPVGAARWVRAPVVRVLDHRDRLLVLGVAGSGGGNALAFEGASADLVRAILGILATPKTHGELFEQLAELSGEAIDPAGAVGDALGVLERARAIVPVAAASPRTPEVSAKRLLVCATGAVWAMHVPQLVIALRGCGYEVRVAATPRALRFFTRAAVESLVHFPVFRGIWDRAPGHPVPHVALAEWADLVLIAPASAAALARIASGACSDLASAICVATRAPIVIAPSMNAAMWEAPSVRRNVDRLREDGCFVVHPAFGVEVAHAPGERSKQLGPAPPIEAILPLVDIVAAQGTLHASWTPAEWDRFYASTAAASIPWLAETLDPAITRALEPARGGRRGLIDLGCGLGTAAIEAAKLGFASTGVDVSERALAIARERAERAGVEVTWLADDVRDSRLRSTFQIAVDRGCLHVIPRGDRPRYARSVASLVAPEGFLLLQAYRRAPPDRASIVPITPEEVDTLFTGLFDTVSVEPCTIEPGGEAFFAILRRRRSSKRNG